METLEDRIIRILTKNPGLRARTIAPLLNVSRTEVNRILYGKLKNKVYQDSNWGWHNNGGKKKPIYSKNTRIVAPIKTIHSIVELMFEEDEDIFALENVTKDDTEATLKYYLDYAIASFYFDVTLDEDYYNQISQKEYDAFIDEYGTLLSSHLKFSLFRTSFSGFFTRANKVPHILLCSKKFDSKYQTCYAQLLVKCFELLGKGTVDTEEIDIINTTTYEDHIEVLQKYVDNQSSHSLHHCDICGEELDEDEAIEYEDSTYCQDCYDQIEEDDEEDEVDEDEEDIEEDNVQGNEDEKDNETDEIEDDDEKQEIVEDCMTCINRKTCLMAKRNLICSRYLYQR